MANNTDRENKVLIIGIDGGTWNIFEPLAETGIMPNLAELMAKGAYGTLRSTVPPVTAPAWSSFLTGKNPGKHGVFAFTERRFPVRKERDKVISFQSIRSDTFPQILSRAGRHVGMINVPITYPPPEVNGFVISGLMTPPGSRDYTYPRNLKERLKDYQIDLGHEKEIKNSGNNINQILPSTSHDVNKLVEDCVNMLEKRERVALDLAESLEWDLLTIVFTGPDRIFHRLWDEVGRLTEDRQTPINKRLRLYFERLDRTIGRLVDVAGVDAGVVLMSDHGFGPSEKVQVCFNLWLMEKGFLTLRGSIDSVNMFNSQLFRADRVRKGLRSFAEMVMPTPLFSMLEAWIGTREEQLLSKTDWTRTTVSYRYLYNFVSGFDINIRRPDGNGTIEPGVEYENLRERIIEEVSKLRDPQNGRLLVRGAYKREDLYKGPYVSQAPDVIVLMADGYDACVDIFAAELLRQSDRVSQLTGTHRPEGMFLISGPVITGRIDSIPSIEDIAPTILYLQGLPIPADMDGRVIEEVFHDSYTRDNPVRYSDEKIEQEQNQEQTFSKEEEEALRQQLRSLGYLD